MPRTPKRPALRVERLEDRTTPIVALFAAGAGAGGPPLVNVYSMDTHTSFHKVATFYAYEPSYRGGVTVATADLNGDGVDDIVTGPGPGRAPTVNVVDGAALLKGQVVLLRSFNAYDPAFLGGVYVAAGSISYTNAGGPVAGIVTGAGPGGGPHVRAFRYFNLAIDDQFYAYDPRFTGGVRVALDTVNNYLVTGAGPGGGPHVKVYSLLGPMMHSLIAQFYAYPQSFAGGVFVAAGNFVAPGGTAADGPFANLFVAPGPGGQTDVHMYFAQPSSVTGAPAGGFRFVSSLTPYPGFHGGVTAAVVFAPDGSKFLVTGPGPGGGPDVRIYENMDFQPVLRFNAFDPTFLGGVYVGGSG